MNLTEKISSYNLITNLVPGLLLVEALRAGGVPFVSGDQAPFTWVLLGYALGLISSRTGSLLIEAWLRRRYAQAPVYDYNFNYGDFIEASRKDPKLEVLLETANGYRAIAGACILFFIIALSYLALEFASVPTYARVVIAVTIVLIVFLKSFLKQSEFIRSRVVHHRDGKLQDI